MRRIVVASANPGKIVALGQSVVGAELAAAPSDLSNGFAEDKPTFAANAIAKAESVSAQMFGVVVLATDGGLLVPGLGARWDPLRTNRFAGDGASAADKARALLRLAADLRGRDRALGWQEALAIAVDGRHRASWVAESPPGELATTLHESLLGAGSGFWVPAVWRCPECGGKRLADLTPDEEATRFDHWMQLGSALSQWLDRQVAEREVASAYQADRDHGSP